MLEPDFQQAAFLKETAETIDRLTKERDQARKAILDFGKNPAGFDWAVLGRIDELETALKTFDAMSEKARAFHDSDQDAKTLKLLSAMAGHLKGYREDIDYARSVISSIK